jgi:arylsulfatase A-like enzyme
LTAVTKRVLRRASGGGCIKSRGGDVSEIEVKAMRVLSLVFLALLPASAVAAPKKQPNVVIVITDDQRWDALSCAGHPYLKTPNLDRIAREGVRFKNAFCTTSLCSPSRASILSGLYAHSHGVTNNFTEYPARLGSLALQLQRAGYLTAYIGKWHMGEDNDAKRPGFDYWVSHKGQGKYFDNEFCIDDRREVKKGYYTHVVTDLATDWMKQQRERPFLLMLGHKAPHSFYVPEPKYAHSFDDVKVEYPRSAFELDNKPGWIKERQTTWHGIYGPLFEFRKNFPDTRPEAVKDFANMIHSYWATIRSVDDSMGRLLQTLQDMGVLDDTIILFMGDNGLLNGEFGMVDKRTMHEPSIRVPLLARYPGLTPVDRPKVIEQMVLRIDVAPTVLELCGAEPLPNVHGKSWRRLVQGETQDWRTAWHYEYNYEKQFPYTPNIRGVRTDEWAYMHYPHGDGGPDRHKAELYNLKDDPGELHNLIDEPRYAGKRAELQRELARLMVETGLTQDRMPLDEGIKQSLPDLKIR